MKDTKLQMLTTWFEELKMSEDDSFDSFYSKLNEVVIGKFNLGEKTKDSKIVRKILISLPKSFCAKVKAIEESKDLDDIKVQERINAHDLSDEDVVDKNVAYLVKNFRKFLKFKKNGKFTEKGKFPSFRKEKKDFKRKYGKELFVSNAMDMAISRRNVLII